MYLLFSVVLYIGLGGFITAIRVIGRDTTVTAGEDAILFWQLIDTNEKLTRITWQRRTRRSSTNENIFVITPDGRTEKNGLGDRVEYIGNIEEFFGTIRLKNVTPSDQQIYTCIFNIFPSGPYEKEIQLTVYVPPVVSVSPDVTFVAGGPEVILVTCSARSRPGSEVSWRLGVLSGSVAIRPNVSEEADGYYTVRSQLIGVPAKALNQQTVQCVVNHTSLNTEIIQDINLNIQYPPQIVYINSVNPTTSSQEFLCVADANPKPTHFIWSRVNKTLPGRVDVDRLIIPQSADSNGLYMCNTSNQYGTGISTVYVQIYTDNCSVSWGLFTTLLLAVGGGLIWVYMSKKNLQDLCRGSDREPVPT